LFLKLLSNIIEWNGILSVKIVQELSLDSLLNRYIITALQYMDLSMETVTKIEYVSLLHGDFNSKFVFILILCS
jgi:hypothetical protein